MHESTLAKRYATALADLAADGGILEPVGEELTGFLELFKITPGLANLMTSPTAAEEDQAKVVQTFIDQAAPAPITGNFLKLLVAKRRMPLTEEIVAAYNRDVERRSGRITANVQTPKPLTKTHLTRLQAALSEISAKEVDLVVEEAPELLGGMVVRMGSVMLDYSVRGRLQRLKAHLTG